MSGPTASPDIPSPDERPLVLIVEDDLSLLDSVRWLLEDEGLLVETASNGQQALERATHARPALVVLDMSLPILSGEEVAAGLKGIFTDPPPIVVMSAAGAIVERARRIGAIGYVAKPFDLGDLLDAVRGALRRA